MSRFDEFEEGDRLWAIVATKPPKSQVEVTRYSWPDPLKVQGGTNETPDPNPARLVRPDPRVRA
jgi:hypothetical protein